MIVKKRLVKMNDDTLWDRIKQTIIPINRDDVLPYQPLQKKAKKSKRIIQERASTTPNFLESEISKKLRDIPFNDVDRKTQRKIDKGQKVVDGKLDLHGMTRAQAHKTFNAYILESVTQGRRCIVVVTGKGNAERGSGVIRRELPQWAENPKVSLYIHSLSEPIRNKGRYIILLRRNR